MAVTFSVIWAAVVTQLSGWLLPALEIKQLLFKKFSHYYCTPFIENKNTVANLVMDATIVSYNSKVILRKVIIYQYDTPPILLQVQALP